MPFSVSRASASAVVSTPCDRKEVMRSVSSGFGSSSRVRRSESSIGAACVVYCGRVGISNGTAEVLATGC